MAGLELISDEEARGEKQKVWRHESGAEFIYHRLKNWERDEAESETEKDERTGAIEDDKLFMDAVIEKGLVSWENVFFDKKSVLVSPDTISRLPLGIKRDLFDRIWGGIGNEDPFLS